LPETNLHVLPGSISVEEAVFIEPLAAACEILDQVKVRPGMPAAVLGDGKLGLLAAQVLHLHGVAVTLYGRHRSKLAIARRAGVETRMSDRRLPRNTYSLVVDATGSAEGLQSAVSMVEPRGVIVMKSTVHGTVARDTAPVIVNEVTLIGSRCGRFEAALPLVRRVRLHEMLTEEFPLSEATRAFERAAERGVLKVLLRPGA
jgi:alcohol dehydrogenase